MENLELSNPHIERSRITSNKQEQGGNEEEKLKIVGKIDSIYMNMKEETFYFKRIKIILFFIFFFNFMLVMLIFFLLSPIRNNYYCFDPLSAQFHLCLPNEYCNSKDNGIARILMIQDSSISELDIYKEGVKVQKKYFNYYLFKEARFMKEKYLKTLDHYEELSTEFTLVIAITTNEYWNLFQGYNQFCNKTDTMLYLAGPILIGLLIANIVFAFLADLIGRKKMLIIICFLQFIGCIMMFIFCFSLEQISKNSITDQIRLYNSETNSFEYIKDPYSDVNLPPVDIDNVNADLLILNQQYNVLNAELAKQFTIGDLFIKYRKYLTLGCMFAYSCSPSSYSIGLAYILENSINDTLIYSNFLFYNLPYGLALIIIFTILTIMNSVYYSFIIIGAGLFILGFILIFAGYESPRHNFEFFEYHEITKTFSKIAKKDDIAKFFSKEDDPKLAKEIAKSKEVEKESLCRVLFSRNFLFSCFERRRYKLIELKVRDITRTEIIKSPTLIFSLIRKNKEIKNNLLIIISLVANISLIFFLTLNKIASELYFSRSDMYNNIIINTYIVFVAVIMIISLYIFNFILKFFGYNVIFFVNFLVIFLFSLIYEIINFSNVDVQDIDSYTFLSNKANLEYRRRSLVAVMSIIIFFTTGLFVTMFFFLTKLTKTIYRCLFYGLCQEIISVMLFFSIPLSQYFEKNFIYVILISFIGFVNSYFIKNDIEFYTIIDDYRKIDLETENNQD
jgi:MFS family permease